MDGMVWMEIRGINKVRFEIYSEPMSPPESEYQKRKKEEEENGHERGIPREIVLVTPEASASSLPQYIFVRVSRVVTDIPFCVQGWFQ